MQTSKQNLKPNLDRWTINITKQNSIITSLDTADHPSLITLRVRLPSANCAHPGFMYTMRSKL